MICLQGEERQDITLPDLEHIDLMLLPLSDETLDLFDIQQMIHRIYTNTLTGYMQVQLCKMWMSL